MDYTKSTNFATKDTLSPGSALKIVRGTEIDTEFNAIATAVATKANSSDVTSSLATKADLASPALTGTPTVPTATAGTNTTQAASTAFVTTAVGALGYPAFKNRIINGAMAVAQRGTSGLTGGTGSLIYTLDRFYFYATGAALTVSQVTGTNFLSNGTCSVLQATGASSNTGFNIGQRIESTNIRDLAGGPVIVSFWVYQSTGSTQTVNVTAYTATGGVDNWSSQNTYSNVISASVPNATWTYVSGTFTLNSTATNGAGISISTTTGTLTSGQTFSLGNIQLEKGSTATSFDYRPYGTELALCQRYFVELYGGTNAYQPLGIGNTYSTTQGSYLIYLPVPLRTATPSLTTAGNIYFQNLGNINISSFAGPYSQKGTIVEGDFTMASAVTANITSFMRFNNVNTSTSKFNFSAEL